LILKIGESLELIEQFSVSGSQSRADYLCRSYWCLPV